MHLSTKQGVTAIALIVLLWRRQQSFCHGIFTDRSIFRLHLNFPARYVSSGLHERASVRKKNHMAVVYLIFRCDDDDSLNLRPGL